MRLNSVGMLEVVGFRPTNRPYNCEELAACPFVYVSNGDKSDIFVGEILRDLIGREAYSLQSLDLPTSTDSTLRIRLSEEKDEKTFLDEIYVVVDGKEIRPNACVESPNLKYCAAERSYENLVKGESLVLEFETGGQKATLWARGFYVPIYD